MILLIERVVAVFLVVVGLSYLVQGLVWKNLVQELLKNKTWLMLWSLLFLPWGLVIVLGHNIWLPSWQVMITILGWWVTIKCVLYLLLPNWSNFINSWQDEFLQRYIQIAGVIVAGLGGIIIYLTI
ncbi:MAG: hypothetical protein EA365_00385 [Gloeocapsa sp. DLM2.Bin57]|nr:MAG: hypothetical protein EA365_00385 [Gloeocapsa sp. DLM2.Bin57]